MKYANEFIQNMGLVDPATCVYQFIFHQYDSNDTKIIQYFIMHGLGLCIKLNGFVSHMFYAWSSSNNKSVLIAINKNKYFPSLNAYTTVFAWGNDN